MRMRSLNLTELDALIFRNQKQNKTFNKTTTYWSNQKRNLKNTHLLVVVVKMLSSIGCTVALSGGCLRTIDISGFQEHVTAR